MGRRTILLTAALVIAALGTALVFIYVQSANDRAQEGTTLVEALVATSNVDAGTTGSEASNNGAFELQQIQVDALPTGYLTSLDPIADLKTNTPIYTGQAVLQQMFSQGGGSALSVPKGRLAVSVQLGDPERVAGFVAPGSDVAIFATVSKNGGSDVTQVLLPTVQVIGVGDTTISTTTTKTDSGQSTTEEISRTILTLALTTKESQELINAQSIGSLYFGLIGDNTKVSGIGATNSQNLFG